MFCLAAILAKTVLESKYRVPRELTVAFATRSRYVDCDPDVLMDASDG
jgi:hypothetical protein